MEAGAFGPGRPLRHLLLSPDHALFLHGVLIPARELLNGASVTRADMRRVRYFHVELDRHDVLLAEGLPAESYLNCGNRHQFEGADALSLHPDFSPTDRSGACAPLCTGGKPLAAARAALQRRLPGLGFRVATGKLWIEAGGRRFHGHRHGGMLQFPLPRDTKEVTLRSAATRLGDDARCLGARISAILRDERLLSLSDPDLRDGFYPVETDGAVAWRWTDGQARLRVGGARLLEVRISETVGGWEVAHRSKARGAAPGPRQGQCPWTPIS